MFELLLKAIACGVVSAVVFIVVCQVLSVHYLIFGRPIDGSSPVIGAKIVAVGSFFLGIPVFFIGVVARLAYGFGVLFETREFLSWMVS